MNLELICNNQQGTGRDSINQSNSFSCQESTFGSFDKCSRTWLQWAEAHFYRALRVIYRPVKARQKKQNCKLKTPFVRRGAKCRLTVTNSN